MEGGAKVVKNAISGANVVKKNKHSPCYMQHSDKSDFFFVILLKYEKINSFFAKYFEFKQNIPLVRKFSTNLLECIRKQKLFWP